MDGVSTKWSCATTARPGLTDSISPNFCPCYLRWRSALLEPHQSFLLSRLAPLAPLNIIGKEIYLGWCRSDQLGKIFINARIRHQNRKVIFFNSTYNEIRSSVFVLIKEEFWAEKSFLSLFEGRSLGFCLGGGGEEVAQSALEISSLILARARVNRSKQKKKPQRRGTKAGPSDVQSLLYRHIEEKENRAPIFQVHSYVAVVRPKKSPHTQEKKNESSCWSRPLMSWTGPVYFRPGMTLIDLDSLLIFQSVYTYNVIVL